MNANPSQVKTRRDRERDNHRREILEAAERVFVSKGYEAATVEEIARESEFAVGTLYNFFEGKEALFLAVADRILEDLDCRFDEEIAPIIEQPREAVQRFVELRLQEITRHEPFFRVFHPVPCNEQRREDMQAAPRPDPRYLNYRAKAIRVFATAIEQGVVRDIPPDEMLFIVEGTIRFLVKLWNRQSPAAPTREEQLAILERSLFKLLWTDP